jgi:autotransporter translocation and assembly factor TamB
MTRSMKRVLLTILLLTLSLSTALGWLLNSESGLRWIYRQAESTLAGALQVQQVSGNLSDGVTLQGLDFKDSSVRVTADQVILQWDPWALLSARVDITRIAIQQLDIELLQEPDDGDSPVASVEVTPLELPSLDIPVTLELRELKVDRITLTQGDALYKLEELQLQAAAANSRISFTDLDVRVVDVVIDADQRYDFDVHLSADIDTAAGYEHDLHIDWKTQLPSGAMIDNSTRIKGNLGSTQLLLQSQGPLQINLSLELRDLLDRLNWQASLEVASFDTSLLQAELPLVSGSLELSATGDLSSAQVSGQLDADSSDLGKFKVSFDLRSLDQPQQANGLQFDSIELAIFDGKIAAQGQLYWSPMLSWNSTVTASDINPASLLPDWPGKLATRLQTEGHIEDGKLTASARIAELSGTLRDYPVTLSSELFWRDDTLDVESANLSSGDTQISANGTVGKTLDLDWSLDSRNLAELYPEAQGQLKASGHLTGEATAPTIEARFNGSSLRFVDYSVEAIDGEVNVDLLNWQQLDVRFAASKLDIQGQHLQSVKVNANPQQILASIDADSVKADIELAGKLDDQGWRGNLQTAVIDSTDFSTWTLKAPAAVSLTRDSISSESLCLESVQQAEVCSSFQRGTEDWDIHLGLARIPLQMMQQWIPPELELSGVVNADGDLKYDSDGRLLGKLEIKLPPAAVTYPLQDGKPERIEYRLGELSVSLEPNQITTTTRLELVNGDHVEGSMVMPEADILNLEIDQQSIEARLNGKMRTWVVLDALIPQIEELSGELNLDIDVTGSLARPLFQGSARFDGGGFLLNEPELKVEQIVADLKSKGTDHIEYSIDAVVGSGKIALHGETLLDRTAGWPGNISLNGTGLDLAKLLAPWVVPPLEISGELGMTAELQFKAPDQLFGELHLSATRGSLIYPLVEEEVDHWNYRDAFVELTLNEAGISATSGIVIGDSNNTTAQLTLPGARLLTLDPESQALEATARVNFKNLELIQYLLPEINQLKGQLALDISAAGSLAQPKIMLNADIQQASLKIPRMGLQIDQINLQGSSDPQYRFNFKISAHSGEGHISIEGSSQLDPELGWPSTIHITGKDFEVSRIPEALVTITPDLKITIDAPTILIEGDLLLPYAKLQPKDVSTAAQVSKDTVVIGGEQEEEKPWLFSTRVNLALGDRVTFFGFGFESKLGGSLLIEDSPEKLSRGTGEIKISEGRYRAYGQRLDIDSGRLVFAGSPLDNPGLDMRAVREVNDITVGLKVLGRLQQPEIELFSDPAMGQTDMLSYLLFGHPMESTSSTEGETMGQAALAFGLVGGDTLARTVGDRFGVDEVRVESNDTGDEASLVVGSYLSPKLYVSYGVGLMDSLNSLNLRYQLSNRWQLEVESGATTGADVFYTIER